MIHWLLGIDLQFIAGLQAVMQMCAHRHSVEITRSTIFREASVDDNPNSSVVSKLDMCADQTGVGFVEMQNLMANLG